MAIIINGIFKIEKAVKVACDVNARLVYVKLVMAEYMTIVKRLETHNRNALASERIDFAPSGMCAITLIKPNKIEIL